MLSADGHGAARTVCGVWTNRAATVGLSSPRVKDSLRESLESAGGGGLLKVALSRTRGPEVVQFLWRWRPWCGDPVETPGDREDVWDPQRVPFTVAHVAAAPPLWRLTRRRLVLSALVVGAMSPDFEYLVRLSPQRGIAHTPVGVAVVCVPASLAVLAVWHRFVGPAFAPLLPDGWSEAARREFRFGPTPRLLQICVSAAVGAFSHLAWDLFTHNPSPMVTRFGILSNAAWAGGPPGWVVLWWASSIGGMLVVAGSLLRLGLAGRHPVAPAPVAPHRAQRQMWPRWPPGRRPSRPPMRSVRSPPAVPANR